MRQQGNVIMTRIAGFTRLLLLLLPVTACEEDEIGTPLSVELVGPGTGRTGEELSVLYEAGGRSLSGIVFTWGDGGVDSLATAGAQTASGSMRHTYEAPGVFTVRARVEDVLEGVDSARVTITVRGG